MHVSYEDPWITQPEPSQYRAVMIASGRIGKRMAEQPGMSGRPIVLFPEAIMGMAAALGGPNAVQDYPTADAMDEVNAYTDLCYALACKNVSTVEHRPPVALNRQRLKNGKLPLMGFHVLELAGAAAMPGSGAGSDRSAARSHLRRRHIRRLGDDRVT